MKISRNNQHKTTYKVLENIKEKKTIALEKKYLESHKVSDFYNFAKLVRVSIQYNASCVVLRV